MQHLFSLRSVWFVLGVVAAQALRKYRIVPVDQKMPES